MGKVALLMLAAAIAAAAMLLTRSTYAADPTYELYGQAILDPECNMQAFDLQAAGYRGGERGIWEVEESESKDEKELILEEGSFLNKNWTVDEGGLTALAEGDSLFSFISTDGLESATYRVEADGPFSYAVVNGYNAALQLSKGNIEWKDAEGQADITVSPSSFTAYRSLSSGKTDKRVAVTVSSAVILKVKDSATTTLQKVAKVVHFQYDGLDGQVSAVLKKDGSPLAADMDHMLAYGDEVALTANPAPYTGDDGKENLFDSFRSGSADGEILSVSNPFVTRVTSDMHAVARIQTVQVNHIKTADDLKGISADPHGYYKLDNNIDLTGAAWSPLGDFSGTLDGSGYAITGLMAEGERAGFLLPLQTAL